MRVIISKAIRAQAIGTVSPIALSSPLCHCGFTAVARRACELESQDTRGLTEAVEPERETMGVNSFRLLELPTDRPNYPGDRAGAILNVGKWFWEVCRSSSGRAMPHEVLDRLGWKPLWGSADGVEVAYSSTPGRCLFVTHGASDGDIQKYYYLLSTPTECSLIEWSTGQTSAMRGPNPKGSNEDNGWIAVEKPNLRPQCPKWKRQEPRRARGWSVREFIAQTSGEAKKPGPTRKNRVLRRVRTVGGRILNDVIAKETGINVNKLMAKGKAGKRNRAQFAKTSANAVSRNMYRLGVKAMVEQAQDGGMVLTHRELVGAIEASVGFSTSTLVKDVNSQAVVINDLLDLNPANEWMVKYAQQFAGRFEIYDFLYACLIYRPSVATSIAGKILFGYSPDPNQGNPETQTDFCNLSTMSDITPYTLLNPGGDDEGVVLQMNRSELESFGKGRTYYVRNFISASDTRIVSQGRFYVGVMDCAAGGGKLGDLEIAYKIRFRVPYIPRAIPRCTNITQFGLEGDTFTTGDVQALHLNLLHDGLRLNPYLNDNADGISLPPGDYRAILNGTVSSTQAISVISFFWISGTKTDDLDGNYLVAGTGATPLGGTAACTVNVTADQIISIGTSTDFAAYAAVVFTGGTPTWQGTSSDVWYSTLTIVGA